MQLTILADNHTIIDRYLLGEPALSFYLEDVTERLLFDVGYSDVFLKNAATLGIDLAQTPHIVFSHGHNDHTRGLLPLHQQSLLAGKTIIAHPATFEAKFIEQNEQREDIGSPFTLEALQQICTLQLSKKPVQLTEHLVFLGEIPRKFAFETRTADSYTLHQNSVQPDHLLDDSALVYCGSEGLSILTGCSHSGICNIVEHARQVCKQQRVIRIIGGFHLFEDDDRLQRTIVYLQTLHLKALYPCHCVSLTAKIALSQTLPVIEVGSGEVLEWNS